MNSQEQDPETYAIIGCAMTVHAALGPGFLEAVYQEALALEFGLAGISFEREVQLPIYYRGQRLQTHYRVDFVCHGHVVVELKALRTMTGTEESIMLNYLKAARQERGLLLNFGAPSLQVRRMIHTT